MSLSHAAAAARLGMPEREIITVQPVPGGHAVQTHDGSWTLITDAGLEFNVDAPTGPSTTSTAGSIEAPAGGGEEDAPPAGTTAVVLNWVGGDPARASAALEAELAAGDGARSTLIAALEKLAGR